jgi:hypothetical protein
MPVVAQSRSIQGGVGREVGDGGHDPALAPQHHRPEIIGPGHEGVARQGVEDEPGPDGDLRLQLARSPARVPGEHPDALDRVAQALRIPGQVDRADRAGHRVEATGVRHSPGPRPAQADRRLRLHRSALEDHRRVARQRAPAVEHLGDRYLGGPVQDQAERPTLLVRHEQDHGALEVGIAQRGRGDQQAPRQRPHRLSLGHSRLPVHQRLPYRARPTATTVKAMPRTIACPWPSG